MYDHGATYRLLRPRLQEAVERVMEGGQLDWGQEVPSFEQAFSRHLGVAHAVGTNSGTAALKVALLSLGVGHGDEVVTVPNSDISTTSAIHHVGARAVWVDVEADTLNMDPTSLEAAITPRTKAIVPVHLYGHPADMASIMAVANQQGVPVVEDACLALGSSVAGFAVGTIGHIGCFSFAPSKHLGAFGSAGIAITNDGALAERMKMFAGYGQQRCRHYSHEPVRLEHKVEGLNERLDELQAAMLHVKLSTLDDMLYLRRLHAARYHEALAALPIDNPTEREGAKHSFRNYVIRLAKRDALQEHLTAQGIASGTPYVPPLHLQPAFRGYASVLGTFPVTEEAADKLLAIPIAPELSSAQIDYVIAKIQRFFGVDS